MRLYDGRRLAELNRRYGRYFVPRPAILPAVRWEPVAGYPEKP